MKLIKYVFVLWLFFGCTTVSKPTHNTPIHNRVVCYVRLQYVNATAELNLLFHNITPENATLKIKKEFSKHLWICECEEKGMK